MMTDSELTNITGLFKIDGVLQSVTPYGSGHINKTYISSWSSAGGIKRYIHQRINEKVFTDVEGLMKNISTVLQHIDKKIALGENYQRIELIPSKDGKNFIIDIEGKFWRTYNYLENTSYIESCSNPAQAKEAGRITGHFQKLLIDLDIGKLNENIRKFTSAPHRIAEFNAALSRKPARIEQSKQEISFAQSHASFTETIESKLKSKEIPRRIVHGDTKINNILFDNNSSRAACLVDLDTCMPGYSLYDFGDLVRSVCVNAAEDEQDFTKIVFNREYFEAILQGYLIHAKSFLNQSEIENMHLVPQLIALTLGVRFLTDYLNSDVYFNIKHESHNLERARTQFRIVEVFKANQDVMKELVRSISAS